MVVHRARFRRNPETRGLFLIAFSKLTARYLKKMGMGALFR
jgi:hypothetical protein